jgi:hypothetical protein
MGHRSESTDKAGCHASACEWQHSPAGNGPFAQAGQATGKGRWYCPFALSECAPRPSPGCRGGGRATCMPSRLRVSADSESDQRRDVSLRVPSPARPGPARGQGASESDSLQATSSCRSSPARLASGPIHEPTEGCVAPVPVAPYSPLQLDVTFYRPSSGESLTVNLQ